MCGRFTLTITGESIFESFDWLEDDTELLAEPTKQKWNRPRYNIAPTQPVPTIAVARNAPTLAWMNWGLVPEWAEDPTRAASAINARIETVHTLPTFRRAFERRRCLVPADGWFEWKALPSRQLTFADIPVAPEPPLKQAHFIAAPNRSLMTFAGLWEGWDKPTGGRIHTFTILTRPAEGVVAEVHDRMPVVVAPKLRDRWLQPVRDDCRADILDAPLPALEVQAVSRHVNYVLNDDPRCLQP